ncbi:MAG: DNA recombination protein RmuC [Arenimonas sp.]|uniref:DNA recombination protein RmuC n=1 Tax=Arenimonas sp. TaxID=1872635 RepID=UPI0025BC2466|nr:DNA recombination protein RmuC [Arenimonas sp.]MBW8368014.1 DNA recombination protein RmuC [Arenimonas sp.]
MSASETTFALLGLLLGLIISAAASVAVARRRWAQAQAVGRSEREPELARAASELQSATAQAAELRARLIGLEADYRQVREGREAAENRTAGLEARLQEQQQSAEQRYRDLEGARERLKAEFKSLAADILEDKSKRFGEANVQQIGQLLNPLKEQIDGFRRVVSESYEKENNSRVALHSKIEDLVRLNQTLGQEAQTLSRALSGDNRSQGYWGELKLERLLETAALEKGRDYLTQESFKDGDGDRYRPDALLRLPDDKSIVIDAKMVLVDYQRACEATDDAEREQHFARHGVALRNHVKQLGEKDYSRLEGLTSPELVLMFVPVEAAFLEALRRDPQLYGYAFDRKIILVGPSNLLASLKLVAQIWRTEHQNANAKAISDRASKLYDKFVLFAEDMLKVGDALERAQKAQQDAVSKLSTGHGNLVRQAEMLRKLGVSPTKRLPASLQDPADEGDDNPADTAGPLA